MLGWKPKAADSSIASVRYRCLIPLAVLQARGVPTELYREDRSALYDAVVFSKLYDVRHQRLARRLQRNGARIVLDLCDNHFYNPSDLPEYRRARADLLHMIELADRLICSTPALAAIVQQEAQLQEPPDVVGDPVAPMVVGPGGSPAADGGLERTLPHLLWFGLHGSPNAPCGMLDILNLAPILSDVARAHPFELVVVSNNARKFQEHIAPLPLRASYVEWNTETFPRILAGAAAVVIPITPNPFTLCKSSNRLATALALGVPVVADAIPSYREFADFCYLDDWEGGLRAVLGRDDRAREKARAGAAYVARHWSPEAVADQWEARLAPFVAAGRRHGGG